MEKEIQVMKAALLLATALFLILAPEPDARTIREMTAQFIVVADETALQASEEAKPGQNETAGPRSVQR